MPVIRPSFDPITGPTSGPLGLRRAGVLLHVTSLPAAEICRPELAGSGDVGPAAYRFVDFLAAAGCSVWQVLPLVPKHQLNPSPYNAISAMAGDVDLVSLELLRDQGLLTDEELEGVRAGSIDAAGARAAAA